ncbi:site-specific integrase [Jatrophihabitans endophyticus]|uniref:tyrosine-type recombinase/integrase n=1 Tax=Jatrophihabitans endophyticus TaxID=1206085 RepID=UPI0019EE51C2|nr:site-specific integrase [Jatrophihabitans endophyticus]MBE7190666.1 site-specific integrase [Jatrophihabitans endophyticus]
MTADRTAGRSSIYREPDGSWRGEVSFGTDPGTGRRLRRKVRGRSRQAVTEKVRELECERDAGVHRPQSWTVATWLAEWITGRELVVRPSTVQGYRSDTPHIVRTLGRIRIEALAAEQVEAMYRDCLAAGLSTGTVHHIRRTLSAAMSTAVDRGYLLRNPVRLAACPRYELPDVEPYTEDQARRLAVATLQTRNGARWLTQLALGLRQGEVLGLEWRDVDLDAGWVTITHQLQPVGVRHGCPPSARCGRPQARQCPLRTGGGLHRVPVKSKAGRRRLKLPDQLVTQLRRTRLAQRQDRLQAGNRWIDGDWVFTDGFGRPYDAHRDLKQWDEICELAGVPRKRTHDLRHTCATLLLQAGMADSVVSRSLGHTDVRMTERYAHIVDPTRQLVADAMSEALWSGTGGPRI